MRELERWVDALAQTLGVDPDVIDVDGVLEVAKDAAHQVMRPAAPVSAFVAGYAAATAVAAGEDPELAVEEALDKASTLALDWSDDDAADDDPTAAPPAETPDRSSEEDGDGATAVPDDVPDGAFGDGLDDTDDAPSKDAR